MLKQDIREQAKMQRTLEVEIGYAIMGAVAGELSHDNVIAALENVLAGEKGIQKSRRAVERTY